MRWLGVFGEDGAPWVIRTYLYLFIILILLIVVTMVIASIQPANALAKQLFSTATDALKIVLGAVLGSLSAATRQMFEQKKLDSGNP